MSSPFAINPELTVSGRLLTYCNCAACDMELLGDSWLGWWESLPRTTQRLHPTPVDGRINGRPYCRWCLSSERSKSREEEEKRKEGLRHILP